MGNQQVRLSLREKQVATLGWLAGMIDADGCLGFQTRIRRGKHIVHEPYIDVSSVCPASIERLVAAFESLGIGCFVAHEKQDCVGVRVSGIERCKGAVMVLNHFMVVKQKEAQLMLEWCLSRNERFKQPYSDYEDSLIAKVKAMKNERNLRDYMPTPCWLFKGEDIVRTLRETSGTQMETV
jgi:hypothetical protein